MKKMFLSFVLLCAVQSECWAMNDKLIELPSQDILRSALKQQGFEDFASQTKIDVYLAGKNLKPFEICAIVDHALYVYYKHLNTRIDSRLLMPVENYRNPLVKAILQNYPKALEALKDDEYLHVGKSKL